jgi:hypothetical protein
VPGPDVGQCPVDLVTPIYSLLFCISRNHVSEMKQDISIYTKQDKGNLYITSIRRKLHTLSLYEKMSNALLMKMEFISCMRQDL